MNRKWPTIDLIELSANSSATQWNKLLSDALRQDNILILKKMLYGIQAGMDRASKNKLNTEKIIYLFMRLQRSIEITAKKIYRRKYPNPLDNPLSDASSPILRELKKKRDREFEKFLRSSSF